MSIRKQYSVEYPFCSTYFIAWFRWLSKPDVDSSFVLSEAAGKEFVLFSTEKDSRDLFLLNVLQDADNTIKPMIM